MLISEVPELAVSSQTLPAFAGICFWEALQYVTASFAGFCKAKMGALRPKQNSGSKQQLASSTLLPTR